MITHIHSVLLIRANKEIQLGRVVGVQIECGKCHRCALAKSHCELLLVLIRLNIPVSNVRECFIASSVQDVVYCLRQIVTRKLVK